MNSCANIEAAGMTQCLNATPSKEGHGINNIMAAAI